MPTMTTSSVALIRGLQWEHPRMSHLKLQSANVAVSVGRSRSGFGFSLCRPFVPPCLRSLTRLITRAMARAFYAASLLAWIAAACAVRAALAAPLPPADLPDIVERTLPGVVNVASTTVINYQVYGMDEFLQIWGIPKKDTQTSLGSRLRDRQGRLRSDEQPRRRARERSRRHLQRQALLSRAHHRQGREDGPRHFTDPRTKARTACPRI